MTTCTAKRELKPLFAPTQQTYALTSCRNKDGKFRTDQGTGHNYTLETHVKRTKPPKHKATEDLLHAPSVRYPNVYSDLMPQRSTRQQPMYCMRLCWVYKHMIRPYPAHPAPQVKNLLRERLGNFT